VYATRLIPPPLAERHPDGEAMNYKEYSIETLKSFPKRWHAEIKRLDGKKIKTFPPDKEFEIIETICCLSAEDAVVLAKELIEDGGME
jgi:hypothetical protein